MIRKSAGVGVCVCVYVHVWVCSLHKQRAQGNRYRICLTTLRLTTGSTLAAGTATTLSFGAGTLATRALGLGAGALTAGTLGGTLLVGTLAERSALDAKFLGEFALLDATTLPSYTVVLDLVGAGFSQMNQTSVTLFGCLTGSIQSVTALEYGTAILTACSHQNKCALGYIR